MLLLIDELFGPIIICQILYQIDDEGFQDTAKDPYPKDHKVLAIVDPSFNFFLFFLIIDTDQFLIQGLGLYRRPARYSIQNHKDIGNKITNP